MNKIILILSLFLTVTGKANVETKGTIVSEIIHSKVLADNKIGLNPTRDVKIYLPPSYMSTTKRFPVVYFCHNIFWSPDQIIADGRIVKLLDRAMTTNASKDIIMVFADFRGPGLGSLYENSTTSGRWLDFITQELIPFIDQKFRTLNNNSSRSVIGDFMGGRGALKLAMSYPSLFGSVYAMHPVATGNGSMPWARLSVNWEKIGKAKTYDDLAGPDRTGIFVAIHQAFLPNPDRPPFYCDFSVEYTNGENKIIPENMIKAKKAFLLDENIEECADNLRQLKGIALDWGRYDETIAHVESNRDFSSKLEDLGVRHTSEEYNGTPFDKLWTDDGRFYTRVLPFLNQHLTFEK
ncbi:MAG: alpha/beta hydrolase-fold protein [Bacteroidota bacterium]